MSNPIESWIRKTGLVACLLLAVTSAHAQQPLAVPPSSPQFLPRFDFAVSLAALASADPRFSYDGRATADFDVVDYVKGRTSVFAQYEVIMGNQLRPFDPNQGSYTFEGSSSVRIRRTEIAGVFHHLSRHLSDRPNFESIAFNAAGGRVMRHFELDKSSFDVRGDIAKVVRHAFLDYSWTSELNVIARRPISPRVSVFGRGGFETYGVNSAIAHRTQQHGGRVEGGVHLKGAGGAVELFAGWEQVLDAYPLERAPQRWSFVGLRLAGR